MRVLKILFPLLALLLVVAGGLALRIHLVGIPHYPRTGVPDLHVESTPERVARGKRWAQMLCADCHANPTSGRLTGADLHIDEPFGSIHSLNITRHPERGIGAWSDGDIAYLLRTGVARDGRYTPPWMAKLVHLSDEDLFSVIAFLRSDDPMVAPSDVPNVPSHPSFFAKFLSHVAFKPYPYPERPIFEPVASDVVGRGRYLAWNLDCWTCHSPDFSKINPLDPPSTPGFFSGGNLVDNSAGEHVATPNLTPDPETGIGRWTEAEFVRALREGVRPDSTAVRAPMATYSLLTDDEAHAIFVYLRTVPAVRHPVARTPSALVTPETAAGKRAYLRYACYSCHGTDGVGNCDLTRNREHWPTDADLVAFIRDPSSRLPGSRMPAWRNIIPDDELAPLVAHLRTLSR
jgi:hypothetical protein